MKRHPIVAYLEPLLVGGILLLMMLSLALSASGAEKKKDAAKKAVNLVWPLPPERPRVKFVASIYGAGDVEPVKKANFLDRLAGIEKKQFKPTFVKPYGIATDSQGRIYVADSGQGVVFVLNREQKKVTYLGRGVQGRLRVPIGIAVDAQDRVWVADAIGQGIYAYDADGNVLFKLGKKDEMLNPTSLAVDDARHRLFVVDSKQHAVLVYDTQGGELVAKFGERGEAAGQFNFPTNVAVDRDGRAYVTDTMNFRVQVFDVEFKFVEAFGKQGSKFGQFLKPKGIALDRTQNIYVVDADFMNFQIFDQKKRLLMFLGGYGQLPGTFWLPAGIHIDRHDFIYVADQNNRRIQIFQLLSGETAEPGPATLAGPQTSQPRKDTKGGAAGGEKPTLASERKP